MTDVGGSMRRAGGVLVCAFGTLVALLTFRPVGQAVVLRLRRRECPAAFDGPSVAASAALAIATETEAFQAQLEHLRAAEAHPDVSDRVVAELREDLGRARHSMEVAWLRGLIDRAA
jgi:hypothetical protein